MFLWLFHCPLYTINFTLSTFLNRNFHCNFGVRVPSLSRVRRLTLLHALYITFDWLVPRASLYSNCVNFLTQVPPDLEWNVPSLNVFHFRLSISPWSQESHLILSTILWLKNIIGSISYLDIPPKLVNSFYLVKCKIIVVLITRFWINPLLFSS